MVKEGYRDDLGILVEFDRATICYKDGGMLVFGDYKIDTDGSTYEEEDDMDYYEDGDIR